MNNLICIRTKPWFRCASGKPAVGPALGEVCEVVRVETRMTDDPFVDQIGFRLNGYEGVFVGSNFQIPADEAEGSVE